MAVNKGILWILVLSTLAGCTSRYGHLTTRAKAPKKKEEVAKTETTRKVPAKVASIKAIEPTLEIVSIPELSGPIEPIIQVFDTAEEVRFKKTELHFVRNTLEGDTLTRNQAIAEYRRANNYIIAAFLCSTVSILLFGVGLLLGCIVAMFLLRKAMYTYKTLPRPKEVNSLLGLVVAVRVIQVLVGIVALFIFGAFIAFLFL